MGLLFEKGEKAAMGGSARQKTNDRRERVALNSKRGQKRKLAREPNIYLAGPDVFLPDAVAFADEKRRRCARYGFVGRSPVDNEVDISSLPKLDAARRISADNEEMIRQCDLVIANVTPFRGPSADVGTVYEMGYARALGLPVFAYTNCGGTLLERTRELLGNDISQGSAGKCEDRYQLSVEDFGCIDNLMIVGAVLGSGGEVVVNPVPAERRFLDLSGFEECLKLAAKTYPHLERARRVVPRPRGS
jgi:nucleoside 2-deoxyribosyltransferase